MYILLKYYKLACWGGFRKKNWNRMTASQWIVRKPPTENIPILQNTFKQILEVLFQCF